MSDHLLPIPWLDVLLILALIALNGVLSMSELAIVSSREARLKAMAKIGQPRRPMRARPGRRARPLPVDRAERDHPDRDFRRRLFGRQPRRAGRPAARAARHRAGNRRTPSGFGLVIVVTTFASLVIGEIVPKQFALRSPEPIAAIVSRPMRWLSKITAPFVWLLDRPAR